MKLMWNRKDGGPESRVYMYGLESKRLGSALVLRFENGSRECYHSHAFEAVSWLLTGGLFEHLLDRMHRMHKPSWRPIFTHRKDMHQVVSMGRSWVVSLRGPWSQNWEEFDPQIGKDGEHRLLGPGREVLLRW